MKRRGKKWRSRGRGGGGGGGERRGREGGKVEGDDTAEQMLYSLRKESSGNYGYKSIVN